VSLDPLPSERRRCPTCRTERLIQFGGGAALLCEDCWFADTVDSASWLEPALLEPFPALPESSGLALRKGLLEGIEREAKEHFGQQTAS